MEAGRDSGHSGAMLSINQYPLRVLGLACLLVSLGTACTQSRGPKTEEGGTELEREGPWQVRCFVDDALVLDIPEVYRTRRGGPLASWKYITADGTVVRGRITSGANCVWQRIKKPPPVLEQSPR